MKATVQAGMSRPVQAGSCRAQVPPKAPFSAAGGAQAAVGFLQRREAGWSLIRLMSR